MKYPITSNTLNSIWPKEHQMENKMLFRLNYSVHPLNWLFTFSNKAIKRFIFMKNTFVLLEGGSSRCKLPPTLREIRSKQWRLIRKMAHHNFNEIFVFCSVFAALLSVARQIMPTTLGSLALGQGVNCKIHSE